MDESKHASISVAQNGAIVETMRPIGWARTEAESCTAGPGIMRRLWEPCVFVFKTLTEATDWITLYFQTPDDDVPALCQATKGLRVTATPANATDMGCILVSLAHFNPDRELRIVVASPDDTPLTDAERRRIAELLLDRVGEPTGSGCDHNSGVWDSLAQCRRCTKCGEPLLGTSRPEMAAGKN